VLGDLLSREFSLTTGHLTALLGGCPFAPSLLTFRFINGLLDFSTAVALGTVASVAGLQLRLPAYLLLVPTVPLLRVVVHLARPEHRTQVLAGSCPRTDVLSPDWFSVGILATGLPLSLQAPGPWIVMNTVLPVGVLLGRSRAAGSSSGPGSSSSSSGRRCSSTRSAGPRCPASRNRRPSSARSPRPRCPQGPRRHR
jgi:hypothetical protein